MANEEQLRILKEGGVQEWNKWRRENREMKVDLRGADLRSRNLSRINLRSADLRAVKLFFADLSFADLRSARLHSAKLSAANFYSANLNSADLRYCDSRTTNFNSADLRSVNFFSSNLSYSNLCKAKLSAADLSFVDLRAAKLNLSDLRTTKFFDTNVQATDFSDSTFNDTVISKVDLSTAKGLTLIEHEGPSDISQRTLQLSQGQIPANFLKGCGLSDWEIANSKLHDADLTPEQTLDIVYEVDRLRNRPGIQLRRVFISYTRSDEPFVKKIEEQFDQGGIRYWRDVHNATAGRMDKIIDQAIEQNPIFLLVLSQRSINSDWVETEATKARRLEKQLKREVICPVALDNNWENAIWSEDLRTQIEKYNILDFSQWENEARFEQQYTKLLDGLNLFYLRG